MDSVFGVPCTKAKDPSPLFSRSSTRNAYANTQSSASGTIAFRSGAASRNAAPSAAPTRPNPAAHQGYVVASDAVPPSIARAKIPAPIVSCISSEANPPATHAAPPAAIFSSVVNPAIVSRTKYATVGRHGRVCRRDRGAAHGQFDKCAGPSVSRLHPRKPSSGTINGDHQRGPSTGTINGDHQRGPSSGTVIGDRRHSDLPAAAA